MNVERLRRRKFRDKVKGKGKLSKAKRPRDQGTERELKIKFRTDQNDAEQKEIDTKTETKNSSNVLLEFLPSAHVRNSSASFRIVADKKLRRQPGFSIPISLFPALVLASASSVSLL